MGHRDESVGAEDGLNLARRAAIRTLVRVSLPEQLGQSRDLDRDPARLVGSEHVRLPRLGFVFCE
jgi:hypothetical protein